MQSSMLKSGWVKNYTRLLRWKLICRPVSFTRLSTKWLLVRLLVKGTYGRCKSMVIGMVCVRLSSWFDSGGMNSRFLRGRSSRLVLWFYWGLSKVIASMFFIGIYPATTSSYEQTLPTNNNTCKWPTSATRKSSSRILTRLLVQLVSNNSICRRLWRRGKRMKVHMMYGLWEL